VTDATDYPAAHSMDTSWFAIDDEGRVARFESGEDGAVPNNAASGGGSGEPSFDTFALDAVRIARVLVARAAQPMREDEEPLGPPAWTRPLRAVFVVRDVPSDPSGGYRDGPQRSSAETRFGAEGLFVLHESAPRVVATTKPIAPQELKELAAHSDVSQLVTEDESYEFFEGDDIDDGLFHFGHDYGAENHAPGAYVRGKAPAAPMKLDEVPPSVREHIAALKLPVHFATAEHLHLADHMTDADASIWGDRSLRGEPLGQPGSPLATARSQTRMRALAVLFLTIAFLVIVWFITRR